MKRGAISIETIVIIILALLTLVIVAAAFTGGMANLWEKIRGIAEAIPTAEVTSAQASCNVYCDGGMYYEFCNHKFAGALEGKTCLDHPINADCEKEGVKITKSWCSSEYPA